MKEKKKCMDLNDVDASLIDKLNAETWKKGGVKIISLFLSTTAD